MKCLFCDRSIQAGDTMHQINEKGVPGIWACNEHFEQGDWPRDPETMRIVRALEGKTP